MDNWLKDFLNFVFNIVSFWWAFLPGTILEVLSIINLPWYKNFCGKFLNTTTKREKFNHGVLLLGFILANFLAFHNECIKERTINEQFEFYLKNEDVLSFVFDKHILFIPEDFKNNLSKTNGVLDTYVVIGIKNKSNRVINNVKVSMGMIDLGQIQFLLSPMYSSNNKSLSINPGEIAYYIIGRRAFDKNGVEKLILPNGMYIIKDKTPKGVETVLQVSGDSAKSLEGSFLIDISDYLFPLKLKKDFNAGKIQK